MSGQWDMACDWKWYAPLTSPAHKYLWFKVFYALSPHFPPWKSHVKDGQVRRWKDPGIWMIGQKLYTHQIHSFGFYMGEKQPSTGVNQILEFLLHQWWTWLSFIWLNWQVVLKSGQEHGLWCQIWVWVPALPVWAMQTLASCLISLRLSYFTCERKMTMPTYLSVLGTGSNV